MRVGLGLRLGWGWVRVGLGLRLELGLEHTTNCMQSFGNEITTSF